MKALKARVSRGRLVLDVPTTLPEGTELDVVVVDPQEHQRFVQAIQAGLNDSEAGRVIDDDELGLELDAQFGTLDRR